MIHFFKLIRIVNLAIIVFTMVGVSEYLFSTHDASINFNRQEYWLLTISIVFIAAGGNMINDYFDLKADRINKPKRVIVTKFIKKRWVIILHWGINVLALIISIYLSYLHKTLLFVFVHLLSINALWFYSTYFKRKVFIGNVVIAGLTALVPFLAIWYFQILNTSNNIEINFNYIYFIAISAFFMNLSREIIKDAEDIEGDKIIGVKSLPMTIGINNANIVALSSLQIPLIIGYIFYSNEWLISNSYEIYFLLCSATINLLILMFYFIFNNQAYKTIHLLIKLSMFIGLLSLFSAHFR